MSAAIEGTLYVPAALVGTETDPNSDLIPFVSEEDVP